MLDISHKYPTLRTAVAEARLSLLPDTLEVIRNRQVPKGNPLEIAQAAAALAAKNTPQIIPYCHPIPLAFADLEFELGEAEIVVRATAKAVAPTGVEMEALTAVSVAALTLYDMLKMLDETLEIKGIRLVSKKGGKSDFSEHLDQLLRAAVIVLSDSIAAGKKSDSSGVAIKERLQREGIDVADYRILPDDPAQIAALVRKLADESRVDLIVTTGGTGFSPRDRTPEAMAEVLDLDIPGIPEAIRSYGQQRTPYSMLSRGRAGLRGTTLIVNLPGSRRGVAESLDLLFPAILHAFPMIHGGSGWEKLRPERT